MIIKTESYVILLANFFMLQERIVVICKPSLMSCHTRMYLLTAVIECQIDPCHEIQKNAAQFEVQAKWSE